MISLSGDIGAILDAERKLGRSEESILRCIKIVMLKIGRKYRLEIAKAAAEASSIPEEILIKRGKFFPRSGKKAGVYGVLSFLAVKLPSIFMDPSQDDGGVSTRSRYISGGFIRNAKKFGKEGRRDFVFKRKRTSRYPISEQKEDVWLPVENAIARLQPDIQRYFIVELRKELSRAFL